jgi:hypothetical protein
VFVVLEQEMAVEVVALVFQVVVQAVAVEIHKLA